MSNRNPFLTSGYESPKYFCDRVAETNDLIEALENDRNVTLMAPRRYGKTGLVENVFYKLRKDYGYKTIVIDLFPTQNLAEFTKLFASAVFRSLETTAEKALAAATLFLKSCRPTLTIDPNDLSHKFSFDIAESQAESTLEDVFGYLARRSERIAIAFDEFQQIVEYPEKGVEALLRSHVQKVPRIGFVFAGSSQHIMREMFTSVKRPFYQSTQKLHLEVIGKDVYRDFAMRHFKAGGIRLPAEMFDAVYDRFDGITWYVQAVLNRIYGWRNEGLEPSMVGEAVDKLIGESAYDFRALLESQPEVSVRLLRAVAAEGTAREVTSASFVARHGLRAPSSTSESLTRLVRKELLYKVEDGYVVYDRLFGEWLRRTTTNLV